MAFTYAGLWGPEHFVTAAGVPTASINVYVYEVGTTTLVTLYTDRTKATTRANPVVADSLGNVSFYADPGRYDIVANGTRLTVTVPVDPSESEADDATVNAAWAAADAAHVAAADPHTGYQKESEKAVANGYASLDADGKVPAAQLNGALGAFYPTAYGAVGDGTTDDTAEVQAAIDAASTAGGGTVWFPADLSFAVSSLTLRSNVRFAGGGELVHIAGSTLPILYWPQTPRTLLENVTVEGLTFQGEVNDAAAEDERSGIYIVYGRRIVVRDCRFYDFKSAAVHVQDSRDVTYENLVVERSGNGWNPVNAGPGRNALEILGTDNFADTTEVANEWTVRNCKVDVAGAPFGGAMGVALVAKNAEQIRATVTDNWVYNAVNSAGVALEAGFARLSTVTNNKIFGCKYGVYLIDTQNTHEAEVVNEWVVIGDNIIDAKNITTETATPYVGGVAGTSVAPGGDVADAVGIDCHVSRGVVRHNTVRCVQTGILVRPHSASVVPTHTVIDGNVVEMAATTAGAGYFGFSISGNDLTVTNNRVSLESGANMRDAYYLGVCDGLTFADNGSRDAGRYAIQLVSVLNATITGGSHLDPTTNGIVFSDALSADVHIGGGILVRDSRGTPTMTHTINASAGGTRLSLGEAFLSHPILGSANLNIDHGAITYGLTATTPPTKGLPGYRVGYGTAAPTTGTWSVGDRIINTVPTASGVSEWVCTTAGTPGTWTAVKSAPVVLIDRARFDIVIGAPSGGLVNGRVPCYLFDAAASEAIASSVYLESVTVNIDLWWSNAGAGAGDVRWRLSSFFSQDGSSLFSDTDAYVTATAPAQNVVEVTRMATGLVLTSPLTSFRLLRDGAAAEDTLANDAAAIGLVITQAS